MMHHLCLQGASTWERRWGRQWVKKMESSYVRKNATKKVNCVLLIPRPGGESLASPGSLLLDLQKAHSCLIPSRYGTGATVFSNRQPDCCQVCKIFSPSVMCAELPPQHSMYQRVSTQTLPKFSVSVASLIISPLPSFTRMFT